MLKNRDYTLVLDKSGSMSQSDKAGGRSRWEQARESTAAFARRCEALDPDGLTLYLFAGRFKRYDHVTAARVDLAFEENEPCGGTDLAGVLQHVLDAHFTRTAASATHDETILVITDGAPDDERAVIRTIVEATRRMKRDDQLAVSFIQIGNDVGARTFLKVLDDDLHRAGAKFDICDTVTLDEVEGMGLTEVLQAAIND